MGDIDGDGQVNYEECYNDDLEVIPLDRPYCEEARVDHRPWGQHSNLAFFCFLSSCDAIQTSFTLAPADGVLLKETSQPRKLNFPKSKLWIKSCPLIIQFHPALFVSQQKNSSVFHQFFS